MRMSFRGRVGMSLFIMALAMGGESGGQTRLVVDSKPDFETGDTLALHFAGRFADESTDPRRFVFNGQLRSLATGEVVGTVTHDATCFGAAAVPCPVLQVTNTFKLPGGTIVNRALESVALDPQHAGFALISIRPAGKSIVAGTGVYADRTGRAKMSGWHDGRELPEYVTFDDFWLIELDAK
jgi:hypothetical protein